MGNTKNEEATPPPKTSKPPPPPRNSPPNDDKHPPPQKTTNNRLNHQRHPEVLTALLTHITTGPGARAFFPPPGRDPLPYFPQVGVCVCVGDWRRQLSAMMYRVYPRDSVDRSINCPRSRRPPSTDTNTTPPKKQHVANSLNALARLREGRRRGQQNATKGGKGNTGKGGAKGDDEKALAAAVERFRDRCAVCTCVRASYVSYM